EDGRERAPTAAILDSQTIRSAAHAGAVGYDAGKKTKGRKRFLLVDSMGMVLGVAVVPADTPERAGGRILLEESRDSLGSVKKIWADLGYSGEDFSDWVKNEFPG